MKKYIFILAALCNISLFAQNYVLDPSFGTGGTKLTNNIDIRPSSGFFADGKYYLFGNNNRFARFNYDGSTDFYFGDYGFSIVLVPNRNTFLKEGRIENGQLYAYGHTTSTTTNAENAVLVRMSADGIMDSTFGVNGAVEFDLGLTEVFNNFMINPDGTIFAIGSIQQTNLDTDVLVCKYLPNGSLDTSFNTTGYKVFPYAAKTHGCAIFPYDNGILLGLFTRVLISTNYNAQILLQKMDYNGNFMTDFGTNGTILITTDAVGSGNTTDNFKSLQIINDKVYICYNFSTIVVSGVGVSAYSLTPPYDKVFSTGIGPDGYFKLLDDGKVMITTGVKCYYDTSCWSTSFRLRRYNPDGTPDMTFQNSGVFTYDFSTSSSTYEGATFFDVDNDRIFMAGTKTINPNGNPYLSSNNALTMLRIVDSSLSTNEIAADTPFTVYPNPAHDILYVKSGEKKNIEKMFVTDILGKVVATTSVGTDHVDVSQLQNGVYILAIMAEGETYKMKFIKS